MGKKDFGPSPLELALAGDEDAREQVLDCVVAPLFDLALHLHGDATRADVATVAGLKALVATLRDGRLPHPDPLITAARAIVSALPHPEAMTGCAPGDYVPGIAALTPMERRLVLISLAIDAGTVELAFILGLPAEEAQRAFSTARRKIKEDDGDLREAMDAFAGGIPLPRGLVERSL